MKTFYEAMHALPVKFYKIFTALHDAEA